MGYIVQGAAEGTWTVTPTGFSANPSTLTATWKLSGKQCSIHWRSAAGTSNATTFTCDLPFAAAFAQNFLILAQNNGTNIFARVDIGGTTATFYTSATGGTWTASGAKLAFLDLTYIIA